MSSHNRRFSSTARMAALPLVATLLLTTVSALAGEARIDHRAYMQPGTVTADDYARAERFLPWNADNYVLNGKVTHHWIGSSDRFWYKRQTKDGGKEFVRVSAKNGKKQPAFDHEKIATGLAAATGNDIDPGKLPFDTFSYTDTETAIDVGVGEKHWRCVLADGRCSEAPTAPAPGDLVSPDGKWAAFLRRFKDMHTWLGEIAKRGA